ncbi:MAG: segregation/condensation protein A [Streptococcaceae bacterium]|jgi:segregation and condensation protein A|nr:segregation/condensation protein A [Streptococcaceae bacterium]
MSQSEIEINLHFSDEEAFNGPLDLLLQLVNAYKVDIFEVPLLSVIEQYLAFIDTMQTLNLELAGDYMVMASQLMLIKSRRLLPTVSEEFQEETEQLEEDLLAQIADYRQLKEVSEDVSKLHDERAKHFSKPRTEILNTEINLIPNTNAIDLFLAFSQILRQHEQEERYANTVVEAENFTIEEKMATIEERLSRTKSCLFRELFSESASKEELITTFLALLELVKTDYLRLSQETLFGDIRLERTSS